MKRRRRYGKELKFRLMEHEPTNEQGTIVLFALIAEDLGYRIVDIGTEYPDAELKLVHKDGSSENFQCEFEFRSSGFKEHLAQKSECHLVVCWQHDWKECPVEVIELSSRIEVIRARESQRKRTHVDDPKRVEPMANPTSRKRPQIDYPDGYEPIPESAKRLARMLTENEQNVYAQLWRNRHSLPLRKDSSGALVLGPRGSHLMPMLSDLELQRLWNDLKPTRPPNADSEHLSSARASIQLGFTSRGALGRKARQQELGWEPDCKVHEHCYTRTRLEEIRKRFGLCLNEEKELLLSPKQVEEVFQELGIKHDRHFVAKYTRKGQLRYIARSPAQVVGGFQNYYDDNDLTAFIQHNFPQFSADTKPIEEAIKKTRLRHQPLRKTE